MATTKVEKEIPNGRNPPRELPSLLLLSLLLLLLLNGMSDFPCKTQLTVDLLASERQRCNLRSWRRRRRRRCRKSKGTSSIRIAHAREEVAGGAGQDVDRLVEEKVGLRWAASFDRGLRVHGAKRRLHAAVWLPIMASPCSSRADEGTKRRTMLIRAGAPFYFVGSRVCEYAKGRAVAVPVVWSVR